MEEHDEGVSGSRNEVSGPGGPVVQARAIYGDVRIGDRSRRDPRPVPRQMPVVPVLFIGRSDELDALERIALGGEATRGPAIAVIIGPGGLGKTSLAAHWLHSVCDRYPDGVLSADLSGHQVDDAVSPSEVLDGFLRALNVAPEDIPSTLHERASLFRSATEGKRIVILLDNAASAAQVRALLPGTATSPGESLVLVTTRRRIAGLAVDGARFIELGPLDESSAAALFGRLAGTDRVAVEEAASREVVRLCGGVPLALCVAGARLAAHPNWPVSRIVRDLTRVHARLSALSLDGDLSVRAAFDASSRELPDPVARAYRAVALIPGPDFSAELAVAALDDEDGQELLDTLADASLLTESPHGRYRMHDLVRLHAREQRRPDLPGGPEGVIARSIDWYLREAVAADRIVLPGRWRLGPLYAKESGAAPAYPGAAEALEWMDSHIPGLLAAVQAAHDYGLHPKAWQLCEALWGTLLNRKHYSAWLASHKLGLTSAQACADQRAEARMQIQLGAAYRSLRDLDAAVRYFSRALLLARDEDDRLGEASAVEQLGVVRLRQGFYDEAITGFTKALKIHEEIRRPRGIALMNLNIGQALAGAGRREEAVGYLRTAAGQFDTLGESYHRARTLTALGEVLTKAGLARDGEEPLLAALEITEAIGASYDRARVHVRVADLAEALGQSARAARHLEQALALYADMGAPQAEEVRARLAR